MKQPFVLYTARNEPIVDFDPTLADGQYPCPFVCTRGEFHHASDLHKAAVVEVYVAGVAYEKDPLPASPHAELPHARRGKRGVMEIQGDDIGKIKPDFYTVYSISNTDTPTRAEFDHKKLDKVVLMGAEIARKHGVDLKFYL